MKAILLRPIGPILVSTALLSAIVISVGAATPEKPASPPRDEPAIASTRSLDMSAREVEGPFVGEPTIPKVSQEVRRLPAVEAHLPGDPFREVNPRQLGRFEQEEVGAVRIYDPLLLNTSRGSFLRTPTTTINFDGIPATGYVPPDTIGDIGPNHYVQMVNASFAVFDKTGTLLAGPSAINSLWSGQGGLCEANNDGDPVVLYDPLADRWLLSQFAVPTPYAMCIAISQTTDPTGAYYLYEFSTPGFPDYPKFGVWHDAYYMSANENDVGAYAFDRANMLAGNAATYVRFSVGGNFMLPSDLDGPTPPPSGSPNTFYRMMDDIYWPSKGFAGADRLELWEFEVDFATPADSTFTHVLNLPTTAFNYTVCGYFVFNCIPQESTSQKVDAIAEWPMWRLQYRNFGTYEALVGNFTVDADGSGHAGIRWFELHRTSGGSWSIYQEGTHAPDADHRWVGSIASDGQGNLALGYSVSSSTMHPSVRYATRAVADSLGTLGNESTLIAGGGSQTGSNRWGDYSSMNVDPADDCTFWYTNEYYQTSSASGWRTRIGAFKIPSCQAQAQITNLSGDSEVLVSQTASFTATVGGHMPITYTWNFGDGSPGQSGVGLDTVSHVFTTTGTYTVELSVDNTWTADSDSFQVAVNPRPEPAWERLVSVNSVLTDTSPIAVASNDSVQVVDRVWITDTTSATFTMVETWTNSLDLRTYMLTTGSADTTASTLAWEVSNATPNAWHTMTKTLQVAGAMWTSGYLTGTLWIEDADPQLGSRLLQLRHAVPDIEVSPAVLAMTLYPSQTNTAMLTISNAGHAELSWSAAENPVASWLDVNPTSGTIAASSQASVGVTLDSAGLSPGTVSTSVQITTNDPDESLVSIPVTLTVACAGIAGVDLSVTSAGTLYIGSPVHFSANVVPNDATKPYSYRFTVDGSPRPTLTSNADPLIFTETFASAGTHSAEIALWNCDMTETQAVTNTASLTVHLLPIYLPLMSGDTATYFEGLRGEPRQQRLLARKRPPTPWQGS